MYSFPIMNSTYLLKARKPSLTESGAIGSPDSLLPLCDCDDGNRYVVLKAKKSRSKREGVFLCRACGRRNPHGIVWRFLVGAEAAGSVLATALYQILGVEEEDGGEVNVLSCSTTFELGVDVGDLEAVVT
jgi:hypothetical protein